MARPSAADGAHRRWPVWRVGWVGSGDGWRLLVGWVAGAQRRGWWSQGQWRVAQHTGSPSSVEQKNTDRGIASMYPAGVGRRLPLPHLLEPLAGLCAHPTPSGM